MLNMKKLIDNTNFDNLNDLSKRWATPSEPSRDTQKENDFKKSNEILSREETKYDEECPENTSVIDIKSVAPRKHRVVPQVIDEDTEHFKNKLEHLLNNFKTDAVSEFMNMKKEMLDYQQDCVKSDTQKYLTMYEDKHKELLETKQKLLEMSREAEKKNMQVELLSEHVAKLNERMRIYKYVSRPFSILYENKVREKELKFKMKESVKYDEKRLKRKSIYGWIGIFKEAKNEKQQLQSEERIENEVNEIVGKFQKEMDMLKQRLSEATRKNEEFENNKHIMQENLKKAFLRGVCAMNMEAMGVLGNENAAEENEWVEKDEKSDRSMMMNNNLSYIEPKMTSSGLGYTQNQSMFIQKTSPPLSNSNIRSEFSENVIIYPQKAESKNYKWKEAPIMGVEEPREIDEPRMQVVRPTTEGKIIKVVDGKSAVESRKPIMNDKSSITSSRKKI